jgi:hypothetical protein
MDTLHDEISFEPSLLYFGKDAQIWLVWLKISWKG